MREKTKRRLDLAKYYLDEFSILAVGVFGVLFSKALRKARAGQEPTWGDVWTGSLGLIIAIITVVSVYGAVHVKWRYNDHKKPGWWKRALTMIAFGISGRAIGEE